MVKITFSQNVPVNLNGEWCRGPVCGSKILLFAPLYNHKFKSRPQSLLIFTTTIQHPCYRIAPISIASNKIIDILYCLLSKAVPPDKDIISENTTIYGKRKRISATRITVYLTRASDPSAVGSHSETEDPTRYENRSEK